MHFSGAKVLLRCLCLLLIGVFSTLQVLAGTPLEVKFAASTSYNEKPVTLDAELYRPDGAGPFPAVVLMHGCQGLSSAVRYGLRGHAENFVHHGYVALIVDSFGPRDIGMGWVCKTIDRTIAARRYRRVDALDALKYLQSLEIVDGDNIFQMGQSNGGSIAIRLAQLDVPRFRASAAYYPWCGTFNRLGSKARLTSPLIVLAGAIDQWTPPGDCQTVESIEAEYRIIVYPGAVHSFDLEIARQEYQGHQVGHDREADTDSRKQMLAFFYRHLSAERQATMPVVVTVEAQKVVYLSAAEIRQLMPSGQLKGVNGYGNPYTISYTADGVMNGVAGNSDEYRDTGKWWLDDDNFCRQYKSWLEAKAACFKVALGGDDINFFDAADRLVSSATFAR